MAIALTLQQYLDDHHIDYDVKTHRKTECASRTAQASHVPGDCLAKGVVFKWGDSYLMAIVPASRHVVVDKVKKIVGDSVDLASEDETSMLFPDCDRGAVPVLGVPYRVAALVDESLAKQDDIYFEGGDHKTLIHLTGKQFSELMQDMPRGRFSA